MALDITESALLYRPSPTISQELSAWLLAAEDDYFLHRDVPISDTVLLRRELQFHMTLLQSIVIVDPAITAARFSTIQNRVLSRRALTPTGRGRPRIYRSSRSNQTYRRAVRLWLFNKLVAQGLNIPFDDPPPAEPEVDKFDAEATSIERIDALARFEKWSEYKLTHKAYVLYTREDRMHLANASPTFQTTYMEMNKPCLKFEDYVALRKKDENLLEINRILMKAYGILDTIVELSSTMSTDVLREPTCSFDASGQLRAESRELIDKHVSAAPLSEIKVVEPPPLPIVRTDGTPGRSAGRTAGRSPAGRSPAGRSPAGRSLPGGSLPGGSLARGDLPGGDQDNNQGYPPNSIEDETRKLLYGG